MRSPSRPAPATTPVPRRRSNLADGLAVEPTVFELAPGHDLRLVIQDEYGRPAAGATIIDTTAYRKHRTDDEGVLVFEGVEPGAYFDLEIFGAGLRPWRGRVEADRAEVVLRIAAGGVLEWPILTDREIDRRTMWWPAGRGSTTGVARSPMVSPAGTPIRGLIRADGLEPGRPPPRGPPARRSDAAQRGRRDRSR